jgi:hypothetical protein
MQIQKIKRLFRSEMGRLFCLIIIGASLPVITLSYGIYTIYHPKPKSQNIIREKPTFSSIEQVSSMRRLINVSFKYLPKDFTLHVTDVRGDNQAFFPDGNWVYRGYSLVSKNAKVDFTLSLTNGDMCAAIGLAPCFSCPPEEVEPDCLKYRKSLMPNYDLVGKLYEKDMYRETTAQNNEGNKEYGFKVLEKDLSSKNEVMHENNLYNFTLGGLYTLYNAADNQGTTVDSTLLELDKILQSLTITFDYNQQNYPNIPLNWDNEQFESTTLYTNSELKFSLNLFPGWSVREVHEDTNAFKEFIIENSEKQINLVFDSCQKRDIEIENYCGGREDLKNKREIGTLLDRNLNGPLDFTLIENSISTMDIASNGDFVYLNDTLSSNPTQFIQLRKISYSIPITLSTEEFGYTTAQMDKIILSLNNV